MPNVSGEIEKMRWDTKSYVAACQQKYGDLYDYSLVNYERSGVKVHIVCKQCQTHFFPYPLVHLRRSGCPQCCSGKRKKTSNEEYLARCRKLWGDKWDLSNIKYDGVSSRIIVGCHLHGKFEKSAGNFLLLKQGCPVCSGKRKYNNVLPEQKLDDSIIQHMMETLHRTISPEVFSRTTIQWFRYGVIHTSTTKNNSSHWNLYCLPHEFQAVVDYLYNGKLDVNVWTSTTPTLMNRWSIKALEALMAGVNERENLHR